MTAGDRDTIQLCLEKGYEDLNAHFDRTQLVDHAMALIEYFIFRKSVKRRITKASQDLIAMSAVLPHCPGRCKRRSVQWQKGNCTCGESK